MKYITFVFLYFWIFSSYAEEYEGDKRDKCKLGKCQVSLFQLVSRPEFFHGSIVILRGVAATEGNTKAIYFDKESYEYNIDVNGVYLNFGDKFEPRAKILKCKRVIVEGRFNGNHHGDSGLFIGELTDITRIHPDGILDKSSCEVQVSKGK